MAGRRHWFYVFDMVARKVTRINEIKGCHCDTPTCLLYLSVHSSICLFVSIHLSILSFSVDPFLL